MKSWTEDDAVIWTAAAVPGACRLTELRGYDQDHWLTRGDPLATTWPNNVRYGMDPQSPQDMLLLDAVPARRPIIVASQRLADFLAAAVPSGTIELLPLTLVNHKKRVVKERYLIVNPLGQQDCLDIKKCGVTWSEIARDTIDELKRLAIDLRRIEPGVAIFRPRYYRRLILLRRSLAQAIDAAGFTGVSWTEPADYREA